MCYFVDSLYIMLFVSLMLVEMLSCCMIHSSCYDCGSPEIILLFILLSSSRKKREHQDRYMETMRCNCEWCLFDLDDTLYSSSSGIASECSKNIQEYMNKKLGIQESEVASLSYLLYKNYGTTMAGLRAIGYNFNYDDYHSFVHGRLPYGNLKKDTALKNILSSLPIDKAIFTNADRNHTIRALKELGLEDCFKKIICFETMNPDPQSTSCEPRTAADIFDIENHLACPDAELPRTPIKCKPQVDAMLEALFRANIDPHKAVFFDDSVRNIQSGKRIGLRTVLVGHSEKVEGADYALENIHNIREALPELWEVAEKPQNARYTGNVALEAPVTA